MSRLVLVVAGYPIGVVPQLLNFGAEDRLPLLVLDHHSLALLGNKPHQVPEVHHPSQPLLTTSKRQVVVSVQNSVPTHLRN